MSKKMLSLAVVLISTTCFSQEIQVNRQNKTIAVTAEESTTADADVAVIAIGYHNYGSTQDNAYQENLRVAGQVVQALLAAKVPAENVESEKLSLQSINPEDGWTAEMKKERRFEARQSWHVTISARQAQALVDIAVKAGANEVEDVDWKVADAVALQAKASGAALAKARSIADQMAKGLGAKLGELVYASNRAPAWKHGLDARNAAELALLSPGVAEGPKLKLFPKKVSSDATVYAVFAIE